MDINQETYLDIIWQVVKHHKQNGKVHGPLVEKFDRAVVGDKGRCIRTFVTFDGAYKTLGLFQTVIYPRVTEENPIEAGKQLHHVLFIWKLSISSFCNTVWNMILVKH